MKIRALTIFPQMFSGIEEWGVLSRAMKNETIDFKAVDLRDYTSDKHRTTDDYPFGGGSGLVMKPEPIFKAIESLSGDKKPYVVYPSPQGRTFNNSIAKELSSKDYLVFLCGRYEGVDERVMTLVDEEISAGDFVMNGGELPSMLMIEALSRFIPGVVGDMESVIKDSFYNDLLDCSHYTRPQVINDLKVPEVLLSGNHKEIDLMRRKESLRRTMERRPDLFLKHEFDLEDKRALLSLFKELISNAR